MNSETPVVPYLQYPDEDLLNDARRTNVIAFTLIICLIALSIGIILCILCCMFFCWRRNSCTLSMRKRTVKYEVHEHNISNSTKLANVQTKSRQLASKENNRDKFALIGMVLIADEEKDNGKKDIGGTTNEELWEDEVDFSQSQDQEMSPPPPYQYPKHLLPGNTQE